MDYTIRVGGEAGQGIQTVGGTLARLFARSGYHVFTHQDYESRVRGGHNFYQIRVSDNPVTSSRDLIDILVALDKASITRHENELSDIGLILYDSSSLKDQHEEAHFYDIPFESLAVEHGGNRIMANTVSVGAVLGILGMKLDILNEIIRNAFAKKSDEVIKGNIKAAKAGHDYAENKCDKCSETFNMASGDDHPKMLIAGNDAIGLGAVASGLKFFSAYPMTPSTGIMNYIAAKEGEYGIIVEQAEDEIAAINMALGASFAGVRSMTGTSGGGFALMTEGISLAGITETPVVIALAQRPGPATGFPTRTEQGDLQFALYGGHGEFPRIIYAPGTPEQAFYLTNKAFEMAEKYQVPVIIMTDQYLADTQWTFKVFDTSKLLYTDYRVRGRALDSIKDYKRHLYTETGVSPMALPGKSSNLVVTDSDEHDEEGHMVEDAETRKLMTEKRLFNKLKHIKNEMDPPLYYGPDHPDIILTGWGSTYGVLKEAVDRLAENHNIGMLYFNEIYPLPLMDKMDYVSMLQHAKHAVCVENNATGQFAQLVRSETGVNFTSRINKYDGRPFTLESFIGEIDACIK
jgi:2-oxoglutarate ferredoxin oxidoreductase subunit alpha